MLGEFEGERDRRGKEKGKKKLIDTIPAKESDEIKLSPGSVGSTVQ